VSDVVDLLDEVSNVSEEIGWVMVMNEIEIDSMLSHQQECIEVASTATNRVNNRR
jgi:hypothetical protein